MTQICNSMKTSLLHRSFTALLLTFAVNITAQDHPATKLSADGGRTELKKAAATPEVQEELESPDGVALELLPVGGWRLYGRGSGTYDFNEADEIRGATQDATLTLQRHF